MYSYVLPTMPRYRSKSSRFITTVPRQSLGWNDRESAFCRFSSRNRCTWFSVSLSVRKATRCQVPVPDTSSFVQERRTRVFRMKAVCGSRAIPSADVPDRVWRGRGRCRNTRDNACFPCGCGRRDSCSARCHHPSTIV